MDKKMILAASFGTSYLENGEKTIGAIERVLQDSFPEYEVKRAFTSKKIIAKLKKRDGIQVDTVSEALKKVLEAGVKEVIIQPTHMMRGYEYEEVEKEAAEFKGLFESLVIAAPVLESGKDYDTVISAVTERVAPYRDNQTAICLMGHGTEAESNAVYPLFQNRLRELGYADFYVGTVEAEPDFRQVVELVKQAGCYKRVVLLPLMIVAGDHANNDMAGDGEDSWKTMFETAGFECICLLEGLGQLPLIGKLCAEHTVAAVAKLH